MPVQRYFVEDISIVGWTSSIAYPSNVSDNREGRPFSNAEPSMMEVSSIKPCFRGCNFASKNGSEVRFRTGMETFTITEDSRIFL